jgi:hypothetical protein
MRTRPVAHQWATLRVICEDAKVLCDSVISSPGDKLKYLLWNMDLVASGSNSCLGGPEARVGRFSAAPSMHMPFCHFHFQFSSMKMIFGSQTSNAEQREKKKKKKKKMEKGKKKKRAKLKHRQVAVQLESDAANLDIELKSKNEKYYVDFGGRQCLLCHHPRGRELCEHAIYCESTYYPDIRIFFLETAKKQK